MMIGKVAQTNYNLRLIKGLSNKKFFERSSFTNATYELYIQTHQWLLDLVAELLSSLLTCTETLGEETLAVAVTLVFVGVLLAEELACTTTWLWLWLWLWFVCKTTWFWLGIIIWPWASWTCCNWPEGVRIWAICGCICNTTRIKLVVT